MVFAYQGDHSLWGYVEIEGWRNPNEKEADIGMEWGGAKFRRLYKIKQCSIREFKKHIPYEFLYSFDFKAIGFVRAAGISSDVFNQLLIKAEGEINCCAR